MTRSLIGRGVVAAVLVAALANALLFTMRVANPVITEDAWYFLNAFVQKDLNGQLTARDFFIKREPADHSQPVHKVITLINARSFELDFWFEGMLGAGALGFCVLILIRMARAGVVEPVTLPEAAILALMPLAAMSLNSHEIYAWPLVTLFYVVFPTALLMLWVAARRRSLLALAGATALCLISMDGGGVLVAVALVGALVGERFRGASWSDVAPRMAVLAATVVTYKLLYAALGPVVPPAQMSVAESMTKLMAELSQSPKWLFVPAAASLVHADHLADWFGGSARAPSLVLGGVVLVAHGWFWRSVLKTPAGQATTLIASALMLLMYGTVAGVVVGRVPLFGSGYLWSHRYVVFYQLGTVALAMQWLVSRRQGGVTSQNFMHRFAPAGVLALMLLLQAALSRDAWKHAANIRHYSNSLAENVFCMAAHPEAEQVTCLPNHQVCGWAPDVRRALVNVLKERHLNVFSSAVQARHSLAPSAETPDRCVR